MGQLGESAEVAVFLRGLKAQSNLSFKALARRAGVGSSTLHRYCYGEQFPADFRVVEAFAAACGATTEELRCLHRSWATDVRNRALVLARDGAGSALSASAPPEVAPDAPVEALAVAGAAEVAERADGSGKTESGISETSEESTGPDGAAERVWWKRRLVISVIAVVAILAAVGLVVHTIDDSPRTPTGDAGLHDGWRSVHLAAGYRRGRPG
jgi:transcriptional regulator with XRE-family HTH domain